MLVALRTSSLQRYCTTASMITAIAVGTTSSGRERALAERDSHEVATSGVNL